MKNIDIAALSSAIVAGTIAIFMSNGAYSWPSIMIGLTLVILLLSYSNNKRKKLESLAFASILAFSMLPIIGFLLELNCFFKFFDALSNYTCFHNGTICNNCDNGNIFQNISNFEQHSGILTKYGSYSSVIEFPIFVIWVILSFIFFVLDILHQTIKNK